jgi:assimilatory nitrate reductase catalytic subunit
MNDQMIIQTTCPYCGVGCGITATVSDKNHQVSIKGDTSHPANLGRLCSKGSALGDTLELNGRLLHPKVYGLNTTWPEALRLIADSFIKIINEYGPDAVAIYGSGQLLTEDYYVANKLMKGFIGSSNIDTNSRLCMASSVAGHKRAFGSDTVPGCYDDYEHAELIILIGSNAAWCHPVIFQRIRAAKEANPDLQVVVIDPRKTATCDIADLHLPLASGSDAVLFNGLLHFLSQNNALNTAYINAHTEGVFEALKTASSYAIEHVARLCNLALKDVLGFYEAFASKEKVMSLYSQGINQSSSGTDKVNAIINCHLATGKISKPGMGPFSLTGQPNAMGGREVGGLANQLAAHMDFSNSADIDRVARFWETESIAKKPGLTAVDLFDALYDGKIKAVWIMGTNPVVSMPNANKVKQALQHCTFVVVSDCIANTDTTAFAHVLLPAQGWSEKDGTVTNSERRISRQRALFSPAGDAKPDWWIISQVAQYMGYKQAFNYQHPSDIFREHATLSGFENNHQHGLRDFDISAFAEISRHDYDRLQPIQWPVNKTYPQGRARFFEDGQFFTKSGKAQFIAIEPRQPFNLPDTNYPLILNTGRYRDQWHTMTRTALATKLNQHRPEPLVEVHPLDAQRYALTPNTLAVIESPWGTMMARIQITDSQQQGNLFVPMHWTEQLASQGRMGVLINPVVDPLSKQPESKHTPVQIKAYTPTWQGFILSRHELTINGPEYHVKIKGEQFYRYELAGETTPEDWHHYIQENFCNAVFENSEWQKYKDPRKGIYRAAQFIKNRLETIIFISTDNALPKRNWLTSLFVKTHLNKNELKALLTGLPPIDVADIGDIICACFNVGAKTIQTVIKEHHLKTYQEVGIYTHAGTNCGSCIPELKALLTL